MNSSFAAIPTLEGLLRNGTNAELEEGIYLFQFQLKEQGLEGQKEIVRNKNEMESKVFSNIDEAQYFVDFYIKKESDDYRLLQVLYKEVDKVKEVIDTVYFSSFISRIRRENDIEKLSFYSIAFSLLANDSVVANNLLKKIDPKYKTNKELMDEEKLVLFEKYKKYLVMTNKDSSLKASLESPMKPHDSEDRELVNRVIKKPMYQRPGNIRLVKLENEFFWAADLTGATLYFDNPTHNFKRINVNTLSSNILLSVDEYFYFNAKRIVPRNIYIKSGADKLFRMTFKNLKFLSDKKTKLAKKFTDLSKMMTNKERPILFSFLL